MRRKKKQISILPFLLVIPIIVIAVMIYNSDLLISMGIKRHYTVETIHLVKDDPSSERVEEESVLDLTVDKNQLLTGKSEKGVITFFMQDEQHDFGIPGIMLTIHDAFSNQLVATLVTDIEGSATTQPLDYQRVYTIQVDQVPEHYLPYENVLNIEMNAPLISVTLDYKFAEYILAMEKTESGEIRPTKVYMDVPVILQDPELPNGCEITSLASALQALGYEADKEILSDDYLLKRPFYRQNGKLYGPSPYQAFSGNPRDDHGFYVFPPIIVDAANAYIRSNNGNHMARDISGASEAEVISYVAKGHTIVIWNTLDLTEARFTYGWYLDDTGEYYDAAVNLHCVVIHGFEDGYLHVMDPLIGTILYEQEQFFYAYDSIGKYALILEEVPDEH